MAIKVLISGYENTGKSTLISKIKNALIINCDNKEFTIEAIHANYVKWKGSKDFSDFVNSKIVAYKEKFNELPKVVVFDTITHLYGNMTNYHNNTLQGFNIHSATERETKAINNYINDVLIAKGINVVVVAHTRIDEKTDKHTIPASGSFRNEGSWLSIVNEAIYIERGLNKEKKIVHIVWLKTDGRYPVRSLLDHKDDCVDFDSFDVNKWLDSITNVVAKNEKFRL